MGLASPKQIDGGFSRSLALSELVTIAAPPPSVTRQQSRTLRGEETMRENILHGEVLAHERLRVELRPFPGGDRNLGQLPARGAVLVHVAGCGQAYMLTG
jgi:hypothetical protein